LTYSLCTSRCRPRTPYDRPRPHNGARPVPLFVRFGPRGTRGSPGARPPTAAAAAAASAAAATATAATAAAAAAAAAGAAAAGTGTTAPATGHPGAALAPSLLGWSCPRGSSASVSAAVGRPTPGCPAALGAAPRRASRADVRKDTGGTKATPAGLGPLPALALPVASRCGGGDGW